MHFQQSDLLKTLPKQFFASLVSRVNAKIAAGADVINLGQGNPDLPTPDYIVQAMQQATAVAADHQYSAFRGEMRFKTAIAQFYFDTYGVVLDPATEVAVLAGSKIGLVELPLALMNPGETLLLPNPGYPDYWSGAALGRVAVEQVELKRENDFLIDYDDIPADVAQRAKFLYMNYPNNPTGAVATADFYEQTVAFAKQNQVGIISDFAYGAIGFDGHQPRSFMQTPGAKTVGIETYTFSKTFNMAGWRVGFAVGNADMIDAINVIQDHLFVSLFPAVQDAAIAALAHYHDQNSAVANLVQVYQQRRDAFIQAVRTYNWEPYVPKGAFYVLMPVPAGYTSASFADLLLEEANVAVADASGFGDAGAGYVRVSLTTDTVRLVEAARRIGELSVFKTH
ncbi:pyridoxal phosphate-dependent aminotransferase [Leuconostoc lactis]|uniref:Pyridoxal phosphate-dependent aminotransferase n=1 Tax=Leuconostoc lactis TaxID=1246 RepID=A0AAP9JA74_LEULA|nr:pyridoxal phosphate-dependent aminotransferase [Leuconostoc lactis]MBA5814172.1 pyridoxal phosphate-dependent aminotransferase [Leuconostoc lactis]MBU7537541.1 pyridoxal phosphate-dependent aminotransferase [Leuconostoc lactis]MCC2744831.1 pyridoxal phosphate-dependent aminotransferase [Leuconostoc lactis]MCC2755166.1 pyridoxal phosphate-dependent aminotransferase [Leuconostoc lactis]MDI6496672.1 pyridoxal phosphate-dependent aminotransferase [Leuconostoc lactis]